MKISIASDHAGFEQKQLLKEYLQEQGHEVVDCGPDSDDRVDYPDFAAAVARQVADGLVEWGVLVCGTGIGMAVAANKIHGVRAVNCINQNFAQLAREHNNANIITLSGRFVDLEQNKQILDAFFSTDFGGGRHAGRVEKIMRLEKPFAGEGRVTVVDHPMVQHKLSILRDAHTNTMQFRRLVRELATFEAYEATRDLPMEDEVVQTPLSTAMCHSIRGKKLAVVPILRAGLGMVDGVLELIPGARVGHLGMFRDEVTHKPVPYYAKLPEDITERTVLVVDPMLATGGSAVQAVRYLREQGVTGTIKMMVLVAAPEGVDLLLASDPDLHLYTCAIDEGLDENAYIVPGLGDAGDRIFGTL